MFSVYVHTNRLNGKKYVGITSMKPERRWNSGKGYFKNAKFYKDIQRLGWDAFSHDVVATGLTESEAVRIEQELIYEYDTVRKGYNNSYGGRYAHNGLLSHECSELMNMLKERKDIRGFSEMYAIFKKANFEENQDIYERLNLYVPMVLEKVKKGFSGLTLYDEMHLSAVVYELSYIFKLEKYVSQGGEFPQYIPFNQAIENAMVGMAV